MLTCFISFCKEERRSISITFSLRWILKLYLGVILSNSWITELSGHDVIEDTDTDYICDSPELRDDAGDPPGVGDRVEDDNRADTDHVSRKL